MAPSTSSTRHIFPFPRLPRELRDMIYGYALTTPTAIIRRPHQASPIYRYACKCDDPDPEAECLRICPRSMAQSPFEHHVETAPFVPSTALGLVPALLALNQQLHKEASPFLYSGNSFECTIGVTTATWREKEVVKAGQHTFIDNITDISPRYLVLLKSLSLSLQLHNSSMQDARQAAREAKLIQERLETLTNHLTGKGHKVKSLKVRVEELWINEGPRKHLIGLGESVVLGLESLRGLKEVVIEGVKKESVLGKLVGLLSGEEVGITGEGTKRKRESEEVGGEAKRSRQQESVFG